MKRNVGRLDQFIRIFIGMALIAYMLKDGTPTAGWPLFAIVGVVLLVTAAFSYCPLYAVFNFSSRGQSDRTA